jgi:carboxylesterase
MTVSAFVYVVHGSNAHTSWRRLANGGYPWWRRWSLFCCELRTAFDADGIECRVKEFRWSGANTHEGRIQAGKALAQSIEATIARNPSRTLHIHIVGHSHGGNVALEAVNHLSVGRVATVVLLANPHVAVLDGRDGQPRPLYWGDAANRVGQIWNLYSPEDFVQSTLARRFHGIPGTIAAGVQVSQMPEDSPGPAVRNAPVRWTSAISAHRAMHSSFVGKLVGRLLRGEEFASAMSAAGLSVKHANSIADRGGSPGSEKTQALIYKRGDARPFEMGDRSGSVGLLFVHGFTASPAEMRPMAEAFAMRSRWRLKGILLPGHGTRIEDMQSARGEDWIAAVQRACAELEKECQHVFVCGLSLGASLACHAALRRSSSSRLRGLILMAPAFGVTLKRTIGLYLMRPIRNLRNKGQRAADYFLDHRLYSHLYTPLNLAVDVLRLGGEAAARLGELRELPVLLFAGELESTVSLDKIRASSSANPWIRFVSLPRSRHILTVEPDRETLFETSAQFVEECVGKCRP